MFSSYSSERTPDVNRSQRYLARSWRWSESPEHEIPRKPSSRSSESSESKRRKHTREDDDYKKRRRSPRRSERRKSDNYT